MTLTKGEMLYRLTRTLIFLENPHTSVPPMRGDEPVGIYDPEAALKCSPHAWG